MFILDIKLYSETMRQLFILGKILQTEKVTVQLLGYSGRQLNGKCVMHCEYYAHASAVLVELIGGKCCCSGAPFWEE